MKVGTEFESIILSPQELRAPIHAPMKASTIRERIITSVIPLIPQISGTSPHTERRNVCLISHAWFASFHDWVRDAANPGPGPIDNRSLLSELDLRREVVPGVHFDFVEKNVWDALTAIFTGGPLILRPFMTDLITHESRPVVYPVKFTISFNDREVVRTADPLWRMASFKAYIGKLICVDPSSLTVRARKDGFIAGDGMLTADLRLNHGSTLDVIKAEEEERATSPRVPNWREAPASRGSGGCQSVRPPGQSGLSLIMSMFEILTRLEPVVAVCRERTSDTEMGKYIRSLITESVSYEMVEKAFAARGLVLSKKLKRYDAGPLFEVALDVISSGLPEAEPLRSLFETKMIMSVKCSECGFSAKGEVDKSVLELEIQSKWLKKATIDDCISNFLSSKHAVEDWECPKCGHKEATGTYKFSSLPPVFVCCVNRFTVKSDQVLKNPAEVYYGPDLKMTAPGEEKGKYRLKGVIASQKQAFKLKFKTFYYSPKYQTWVTVADGSARSIQVSTVVVPSGVFMLFYVRERV